MADEEIAREVYKLGKVVVTVVRGNFSKGGASLWQGHLDPDTQISSKKVVETERVSHAVKSNFIPGQRRLYSNKFVHRHTVLGPAPQPEDDNVTSDWVALEGEKGTPVRFTIRYRSRDALQKLKIIPRDIHPAAIDLTDSPPTSPKIKLEEGIDDDTRSVTQPLDG
jgi:hypothetical protein